MWHGAAARLHEGTVVALRGMEEPELADQCCAVQRYDAAARKWIVRLVHPRFRGREIEVAEEDFCFRYCVLPENARAAPGLSLQEVEAQGNCGRGLNAARAYEPGETIFEEKPFLLAEVQGETMWLARWLAYLKLYQSAKSPAKSPGGGCFSAAVALGAFEKLHGHTADTERQRSTEEAAEGVCRHCFKGDDASKLKDSQTWSAHVTHVASVLARWQANQFHYQSGSLELGASAVFRRISRINHSCDPSCGMELHWGPLAPGTFQPDDGRAVVRCKRALKPGDPLCFNYGPKDLVSWPLAKRREYFVERHGFVCGCPRCSTESATAVALSNASPSVAAALPQSGGAGKGVACRRGLPPALVFRCLRLVGPRGAFPRGRRQRV